MKKEMGRFKKRGFNVAPTLKNVLEYFCRYKSKAVTINTKMFKFPILELVIVTLFC